LPDYPNRDVAKRVTVRQLLSHTSGLGNFWDAWQSRPAAETCSTDEFLALFVHEPLESEPGKTFAYSNSGYILLGLLIETVTGESYHAHVERTVFSPLQMKDTGSFPLDQVVPMRATGHARSQEQPGHWLSNSFVNVFCGTSAGGGYSTADDLLKFGRALAQGSLLEPGLMSLYTTGVHPYSKGKYALGLSEEIIRGRRVIGHSGGHIGIANELLVVPQTGEVAVILTNGDVDAFWNVRNTITRALLGDDDNSSPYWRTLAVIARAEEGGAGAGLEEAARAGGAITLREGVIDVTAGKWLHRGDAKRALALFELNVKLFPDSADALLRLADAARVLDRKALALSTYVRYLERVPDDKEAALRYRSLTKAD
jgi:D-alanyl-D-alanine carboxypeptidase